MTTWIAVVLVGAVSYALRAVPLFSRRLAQPGPRVSALLSDAGIASLTAIVVLSLRSDVARFDRHAVVVTASFAVGIWMARAGRALPVVVSSAMAAYVAISVAINQL